MRAIDHIVKEGKLLPLAKGEERFFLKVLETREGVKADLWVFDAFPGEKFKGIPVRLAHLSRAAPSFRELMAVYRKMGFRALHPYHRNPKWFMENDLEERINTVYRASQA
ncbi:MAG: hypothetical protein QFX35_01055 [Candidatus Verstraetearchaeota archaeon]|nr:hypothetical protein [Candidatus Verstraetearchaeota archaeon]